MDQSIYRFKITNPELKDKIIDFANYYLYSDKDTLKNKYNDWYYSNEIQNLIIQEETILNRYNYDLNKNSLYNKIFISIKYYYIKKILNDKKKFNKSTKKNNVKEIYFSKELINNVKQYINNNKNYKPSICINMFIDNNKNIIENEKEKLNNCDCDFDFKFKKMFKNQYFIINKGNFIK